MKVDRYEQLVESLLDEAFRELQHDSGPQDREYRHLREVLRKKYDKLLRPHLKVAPEKIPPMPPCPPGGAMFIDPRERDLVAWISEALLGYREGSEESIRSRINYLVGMEAEGLAHLQLSRAASARGGKIGGQRAAANMTAEQRRARAKNAVAAREAKRAK